MATQPVDGSQYKRITATAAGTTNVLVRKGTLHGVYLPATKTGTASLYDQNAGSAASTLICEIANTTGTIPTTVPFGLRVKDGLTVVTGGTVDFTLLYD